MLRLTDTNTIIVPYAFPRYGQTPALLDILGEFQEIRTIFGTVKLNYIALKINYIYRVSGKMSAHYIAN